MLSIISQGTVIPRRLKVCSLLALLAAGFSAPSVADTYFKWKNEQGVWTYGEHPPQGVEAVAVKTTSSNRPVKSTGNAADTGEAEEAAEGEAQTEYFVTEQAKVSKEEKDRLCKAAKANLETLNSSAVIRKRDADGNVVVISTEEREAEIENAKQTINDFC